MRRLGSIDVDTMTNDEADLLRAYIRSLQQYRSYCPSRSLKPSPPGLLRYLLNCVTRQSTTDAAAQMGLPFDVLKTLVNGERMPTSEEAEVMAKYFRVVPDAFLTVPIDDDD
jgi:hypothetical protein